MIVPGFGVATGPDVAHVRVVASKKVPHERADNGEQQTESQACDVDDHKLDFSVAGSC